MPKNTGRRVREGAVERSTKTQVQPSAGGTWVKRSSSTGRFKETKQLSSATGRFLETKDSWR